MKVKDGPGELQRTLDHSGSQFTADPGDLPQPRPVVVSSLEAL